MAAGDARLSDPGEQEALGKAVLNLRGQHRQHMLETPNRLTSVAKESLAGPWCDRLGTHKCHVCLESRSRDGCCSVVVIEVKEVWEDGSEGGEKPTKRCDT